MEINNTILVVDDDMFLQSTTCKLLKMNGFEVDTADNGEIGVQKALEMYPDLILMDINMPVMNGYDATRTLRKQGYNGPIIAFTGNVRPEDSKKALKAGCVYIFEKPFTDCDMFIGMIKAFIKESKPQNELVTV